MTQLATVRGGTRLEQLLAALPTKHAVANSPRTESVEPDQFIKLGGKALQPFRSQFEYGRYTPDALRVCWIDRRPGRAL
jgi:hypothetical protein